MAIEVDKRKIDNTNTIYENVGKVINGDEKVTMKLIIISLTIVKVMKC